MNDPSGSDPYVVAPTTAAYHDEPRWSGSCPGARGNGDGARRPPEVRRPPPAADPVWGYEDESDPVVMAKKIDAAATHGVNTFIFDWYWYENEPFLEEALNRGFLAAANRDRVSFYLMWPTTTPHAVDLNRSGGTK